MEYRICRVCNQEQPLSCFSKQQKKYSASHGVPENKIGQPYGDTHRTDCNACRKTLRKETKEQRKKWSLKTNYGLSPEEFLFHRKAQNFCCKICGKHENDVVYKTLYVDHCHSTNEVRGLLCSHCNTGLGYFKDKIELLYEAANYLEKISGY